jgi:hypothetical protein
MAMMMAAVMPSVVMSALMIASFLAMRVHAGTSLFTRRKLATPGG